MAKYKVVAPLVIIADADAVDTEMGSTVKGSPRYFYQNSILPDGLDQEKLDELKESGMIASEKEADKVLDEENAVAGDERLVAKKASSR